MLVSLKEKISVVEDSISTGSVDFNGLVLEGEFLLEKLGEYGEVTFATSFTEGSEIFIGKFSRFLAESFCVMWDFDNLFLNFPGGSKLGMEGSDWISWMIGN